MKILMVNKFLYPNGGSETYIFKLGDYLKSLGHEVQYFGMEHKDRIVSNHAESYTTNIDFHSGTLQKVLYPFKIIYSWEAREKIRLVLEDFKPDVVHMNNINYQITPSIIYEIKKYGIPIVQTVHDSQIACPNHRLYIETEGTVCERCLSGNFFNCVKHRCLQGSITKSMIAAIESYFYHLLDTYNLVNKYICPSRFIAERIVQGGVEKSRITIMYNFSDQMQALPQQNVVNSYVLYFGRLSQEKGINTLIFVCRELPEIPFVFAGNGPLVDSLTTIPNIDYVGFKKGEELQSLIRNAAFSLYPSEWYENCPLSVIESQALGTPVIGSDLGGIKELIEHGKTGLIFKAGDAEALKTAIKNLWEDMELREQMQKLCLKKQDNSIDVYTDKLLKQYQAVMMKPVMKTD